MHSNVRRGRWISAMALVVTAVGLLLLVSFDVTLCPFAALFGVPCPGCGLTRAALSLARGQWALAMHFHPLSPLIFPVLGACFVCAAGGDDWLETRGFDASRVRRVLAVSLAALLSLMLVVWVARFGGALGGPIDVDPPLWQRLRR